MTSFENNKSLKVKILEKLKATLTTALPAVLMSYAAGQPIHSSIMTLIIIPLLPWLIEQLFDFGWSETIGCATGSQFTVSVTKSYNHPDYGTYTNSYFGTIHDYILKHIPVEKGGGNFGMVMDVDTSEWFLKNQMQEKQIKEFEWVNPKTEKKIKLRFEAGGGSNGKMGDFKICGSDKQELFDFVEEAKKTRLQPKTPSSKPQQVIVRYQFGMWKTSYSKVHKTFDNVFLRPSLKEELLKDLGLFKHSQTVAEKYGIPYKRGYLLYGEPGTGKTSSAFAIASHLGRQLYIYELGQITCREFETSLTSIVEGSVILFDDIDTVAATHQREDESTSKKNDKKDKSLTESLAVDLATLLKVFDGYENLNGCIIVFTTNYPDKLEPALLRPGRIDKQFKVKHCNLKQMKEILCSLFNDELCEKILQGIDPQQFKDCKFKVCEIMNVWLFPNVENWKGMRTTIQDRMKEVIHTRSTDKYRRPEHTDDL